MTAPDDRDDDDLLARYRAASARHAETPRTPVRDAILAEGWRVAAARRARSVPAAPRRHFALGWIGTLAAAVIAALIVVPGYREHPAPPPETRIAAETPRVALGVPPPVATIAPAAPAAETAPAVSDRPAPVRAAPPTATATEAAASAPRAARAAPPPAASGERTGNNEAAPAAPAAAALADAAPPRAAGHMTPLAAPAAKSAAAPLPHEAAGLGTELRRAIVAGDGVHAARLLEQGASPTAAFPDGRTPLLVATMLGRTELVQLLLGHGADPNAAGPDGRTPLAEARARGLADIVTLLENAGAR
jgi:hypothetical protein